MLRSRLDTIALSLDEEIKPALRVAAEMIEDGAKARVPVDSGALKDSIRTDARDDGYAVLVGDSDTFYAWMVEAGTVRTPARPFLLPAVEAVRADLDNLIRNALKDL